MAAFTILWTEHQYWDVTRGTQCVFHVKQWTVAYPATEAAFRQVMSSCPMFHVELCHDVGITADRRSTDTTPSVPANFSDQSASGRSSQRR